MTAEINYAAIWLGALHIFVILSWLAAIPYVTRLQSGRAKLVVLFLLAFIFFIYGGWFIYRAGYKDTGMLFAGLAPFGYLLFRHAIGGLFRLREYVEGTDDGLDDLD